MKKVLQSKLKRLFPIELLIDLNYITYTDNNNTRKGKMIEEKLVEYKIDFLKLGSGTNRIGIQIEDFIVKIALDTHGKMDNRREFKYTDKLQPFVIKVYECLLDGLIITCEALTLISEEEFTAAKSEIIPILSNISKNFFIGDIGFDSKNYANWGRRKSDKSLCILDFAYVYSVGYQTFTCTCELSQPFLRYDQNYVYLICPVCGRKWAFGEIRKRISKQSEAAEVGNVGDISYNLRNSTEVVDENPNYTISLYNESMKKEEERKEKDDKKRRNREIIEKIDRVNTCGLDEFAPDDPTSFEELIARLKHQIDD